MMSTTYSQYLRDEQICNYNSNNKETKTTLILSLEARGVGQ